MQPAPGPLNHEVDAAVVLGGLFDPRPYPFPYLAVVANFGLPGTIVSALMTAVGMLKEHGWELVSVAETGGSVLQLTAFLKRV
ncbi:transcriptional regulator [Micromonosporaceae bacterium Da 78-11]